MRFIWDENKNAANIAKYGFNFEDAYRIFQFHTDIITDEREDYGEVRYIVTGLLNNRVVVMVYTEPEEDKIRIISLRRASAHERKFMNKLPKTDWARIDAMTDEDIDFSDIPPITDEMYKRSVRHPPRLRRTVQVCLRDEAYNRSGGLPPLF